MTGVHGIWVRVADGRDAQSGARIEVAGLGPWSGAQVDVARVVPNGSLLFNNFGAGEFCTTKLGIGEEQVGRQSPSVPPINLLGPSQQMKPTLAAIMAALAAYEAVALLNEQDGDTISEVVWRASTRRPLVPFAFGVLMGHFFWQEAKTNR